MLPILSIRAVPVELARLHTLRAFLQVSEFRETRRDAFGSRFEIDRLFVVHACLDS
jgi:hypothetical protein